MDAMVPVSERLSLYTSASKPVIPAWIPVSSHREVKLWIGTSLQSSVCKPIKLPSMALDSGIHAGMTVLFHSIWLMTAGIIYCELPNSIFKFLIFEDSAITSIREKNAFLYLSFTAYMHW